SGAHPRPIRPDEASARCAAVLAPGGAAASQSARCGPGFCFLANRNPAKKVDTYFYFFQLFSGGGGRPGRVGCRKFQRRNRLGPPGVWARGKDSDPQPKG